MARYLVFWLIDEEAETPLQAAIEALNHQRPDPAGEHSIATVFEVYDKDTGEAFQVDLGEDPGDTVALINTHDPDFCRLLGRLAAGVV